MSDKTATVTVRLADLPEVKQAMETADAEIERLTAAIQDAVIELVAAHSPRSDGPFCVTCGAEDGSWPCVSAMVADDLRQALQNGSERISP